MSKICPNPQCRYCVHHFTEDDPAFIVNGTHHYCEMETYPDQAYGFDSVQCACIDSFYHDRGTCELFEDNRTPTDKPQA